MVPHWDLGWGWRQKPKIRLFLECSLDLLVGLILSYLIFGQHINLLYFLGCLFLSIIWDVMETPYWFFKLNQLNLAV